VKAEKVQSKSPEKQTPEKLTMEQKVRREIIAWFWVGLVFLLINGAIGQARVIPSGSMENTLLIGDHLIMSRVGYDAGIPFTGWHVPLWRNPKRQQIIIFKPPFDTSQPDYVKRAIGLPGDVIDIHDGAVWINGQRLVEPYTLGKTERVDPGAYAGAFTGLPQMMPYKIPENCYFAMGDNRQNSFDSRFWGCVPRNDIIGTPVLIYMSLNAGTEPWQPGKIGERFLAYLNGIVHPGTVRWRRLFHVF
jgi:signal peptidase I